MSWDFRITGYAGSRHPNGAPFGAKLLTTSHRGESSASIEIDAWKVRMARHEVSRVELIDLRPDGGLTNLDVQPYTKIGWSWEKD